MRVGSPVGHTQSPVETRRDKPTQVQATGTVARDSQTRHWRYASPASPISPQAQRALELYRDTASRSHLSVKEYELQGIDTYA